MRVGIFGSYNQGSIGDYAILAGIIKQFLQTDPETQFVVFAFDPQTAHDLIHISSAVRVVGASPTLRRKPRTAGPRSSVDDPGSPEDNSGQLSMYLRRVLKPGMRLPSPIKTVGRNVLIALALRYWQRAASDIRSVDLMIIGGGNLVMDLYPRWPIYPLMYAVVARLVGTPVVFYGVGAGPIRTLRGRLYLACACRLARLLTFRDQESLDLVRKKLCVPERKTVLAADPALHLQAPSKKMEDMTTIGITLVPYFSPDYWPNADPKLYRRYSCAGTTMLRLLSERDHTSLSLLATNYPHDMKTAREVARRAGLLHSPNLLLVDEKLSVADILDAIAACDIIVGTRLHSLVLAVAAGVPFVAISYQPKVASFARRCGMEEYLLDISDFIDHPGKVADLVEKSLASHHKVVSTLAEAVKDLRQDARQGHMRVLEILGNGCAE